jgi:hypothetical protein
MVAAGRNGIAGNCTEGAILSIGFPQRLSLLRLGDWGGVRQKSSSDILVSWRTKSATKNQGGVSHGRGVCAWKL